MDALPPHHDAHDLSFLPPEGWAAYEALQDWFETRIQQRWTSIHDEARWQVETSLLDLKGAYPKPPRVRGWARTAMFRALIKIRKRHVPVISYSDALSLSLSLSL